MNLLLTAAALVLPAAAPSGEGIAITHSAPSCAPADRYLRMTAAGSPADAVASAELQFRGGPDGDWYAARMEGRNGAWSAYLPRARRGTARVEYRIVMTGADAVTSATPVHVLAVEAACASGDSAVEVAAPIVVRVPAGAPLVPPVPPGFNPAGVVAAEGPPPGDKWKIAKWAGGAVAAATVGAFASGAADRPEEPPDISDFAIAGLRPDPGASLSLQRDRLVVLVDVAGEPAEPLTFTWILGLRRRGLFEACVTMTDVATIGAQRPQRLELSAPMRPSGFCAFTFPIPVDSARLTIVVDGQVAHELSLDVPFTFVP
jgi:hypothetical protein